MRNTLMLCGFERHKNNFQNAKLEARKKISALVKMVRWYLGNQLFFFTMRPFSSRDDACEERSMPGNELEKANAGDGILESVRHHAWPQALPQVRQYAEENSIESNHNHHSRALVSVRQTKENSRSYDADDRIAAKRAKLALQISAENNFFKQARGHAQEHKESGFKISVGSHGPKKAHGIVDRFLHIVEINGAQGNADPEKNQ